MMTATTRRLWLYAVLLLLPALAVGGLALGLLAREQTRLAERETAAGEARRAAVETRARLIAENIELLVGDVQSALMATLAEAPEAEPREFLTDWRTTNPLVREVFRATADGRPVWGAAGGALRGWLAEASPWRASAEVLAPLIAPPPAGAPAVASAPSPRLSAAMEEIAMAEEEASSARQEEKQQQQSYAAEALDSSESETQRRGISSNVSQYQRARQNLQEIAKIKGTPQNQAPSSRAPMPSSVVSRSQALDSVSSDGLVRQDRANLAKSEADLGDQVVYGDFIPQAPAAVRVQDYDAFSSPAAQERDVVTLGFSRESPGALASAPARSTRSGWAPWEDADGLHLFGWRELSDGTVIGLELRLDAIKSRLGEVFPAAPEPGEAYALRDAAGQAWHEVGASGLPSAVAVPLAAASLPGWSVVGQMAEAIYSASSDGGFFKVGAALVALLVFAILAAGGLLMRQARLSEQEAVLKTSFVANVSHELKTPLTTIRLYADLLAQGRVRDEAKRVAYLETIGHETQRLARLVGNVLDFSRLEQGKKKYERVEFGLAAELHRLAQVHGPRLAEAGLVLRVDAPEVLPVATDRDAVEQIVLNLLDNACKYAADGGEVLLSAKKTESGISVAVADRGPGVPAEQRERIFEKFHRVDDLLTAEKSGAGLGLSIARQLARGLGGDLACRAREGGGAVFVLTLNVSTTNHH